MNFKTDYSIKIILTGCHGGYLLHFCLVTFIMTDLSMPYDFLPQGVLLTKVKAYLCTKKYACWLLHVTVFKGDCRRSFVFQWSTWHLTDMRS